MLKKMFQRIYCDEINVLNEWRKKKQNLNYFSVHCVNKQIYIQCANEFSSVFFFFWNEKTVWTSVVDVQIQQFINFGKFCWLRINNSFLFCYLQWFPA